MQLETIFKIEIVILKDLMIDQVLTIKAGISGTVITILILGTILILDTKVETLEVILALAISTEEGHIKEYQLN